MLSQVQPSRSSEDTAAIVEGDWLLQELVADLDAIHVVLVLQACRMLQLWGHGGLHLDFKGQARSPKKEMLFMGH